MGKLVNNYSDQNLIFSLVTSYEFTPNEFVSSLECMTLETLSTETGNKEFITVRTTIDCGEDLAIRGTISLAISGPYALICVDWAPPDLCV
jgi:hypothetical protein